MFVCGGLGGPLGGAGGNWAEQTVLAQSTDAVLMIGTQEVSSIGYTSDHQLVAHGPNPACNCIPKQISNNISNQNRNQKYFFDPREEDVGIAAADR